MINRVLRVRKVIELRRQMAPDVEVGWLLERAFGAFLLPFYAAARQVRAEAHCRDLRNQLAPGESAVSYYSLCF